MTSKMETAVKHGRADTARQLALMRALLDPTVTTGEAERFVELPTEAASVVREPVDGFRVEAGREA